jgi:glycosyltransferase involved in cell wall biosynthesis
MLSQQPLVSIVTPTYNRCHTLPRLWRSLECQSLSQFEWIVVNDCSTDDTEPLMNSLMEQDQRIRYIKHPVNRGVNAARQSGAEQARADFLVFVASDDMLYDARTLEAMYQEIVRAPSNVGEVCFVSVFADGTPAAHVPEDRLVLGYVDLICGNRVRGEFLGICRREFVQRVPFSTYRSFEMFESVHKYERGRYFDIMFCQRPARIYHSDSGNQLSSGSSVLRYSADAYRAVSDIIVSHGDTWRQHCPQRLYYHHFLASMYAILSGNRKASIMHAFRALKGRYQPMKVCAVVFCSVLPSPLVKWLFRLWVGKLRVKQS